MIDTSLWQLTVAVRIRRVYVTMNAPFYPCMVPHYTTVFVRTNLLTTLYTTDTHVTTVNYTLILKAHFSVRPILDGDTVISPPPPLSSPQ